MNIKKLAQSAFSLWQPKVAILLYHRVFEEIQDPHLLCVSPDNFSAHLAYLSRNFQVISLDDLAVRLKERRIPKRGVVITLDDGYADNLYNAKPLLMHYEVPATVFLTTGQIGSNREFWWDELEQILLQPGILPEILQFNVNGLNYSYNLGKAARYDKEIYQRNFRWNVYKKTDPGARQELYRYLYNLLRYLHHDKQQNILDSLTALAGIKSIVRQTHRILSQIELGQLIDGRLIKAGAHTITHPVLSNLPVEMQKTEIIQSKNYLEKILNCPINSFSYPYGRKIDYAPQTEAILKDAKFTCACLTQWATVKENTGCFQLPRFSVENCGLNLFKNRLRRWFCG